MKNRVIKLCSLAAAALLMSVTFFELSAEARAGGGRSLGSRGSYSRSYSRPAPTYPQSAPLRQQPGTAPLPQQPAGGGFLRSMAGGMAGGMLGSMLFSGMAGAGSGAGTGAGGGGIGLFELVLLAGGGYLVYRMVRNRRQREDRPWR